MPDLVRERPADICSAGARILPHRRQGKCAEGAGRAGSRAGGKRRRFLIAQIAAAAADYETAGRLLASIRSEYPDRDRLDTNWLWSTIVPAGSTRASRSAPPGRPPPDRDIFNLMAWCLSKKGNFKDAVAAMDLAIEREPATESNYLDLGLILLSRNRVEVALEVAARRWRSPQSHIKSTC